MKITRPFALAILLFFALPALQAQVSNQDTMVHRIFASLKAKDQQAFVALYPNAQQFGRFIRNIMEQTMKSDQIKALMEADEKTKGMNLDSLIEAQVATISAPEAMVKMQDEFAKVFKSIIDKGEKRGVKWSEATLTGYTIDTVAVEAEGAPFQPKGIKEAKGVIEFTVGNVPYQLAFNKMMFIESEGSWFGADFPQLARKGESLQPDAEPTDEGDDIAAQQKTPPTTKEKAPIAKKSGAKKAPVRKKS